MTSLPTICIDAKRTSFRDDAIGIRPRAGTGRKVVKEGSKWEILIHIADVSDIFSPKPCCFDNENLDLSLLRQAAESPGESRYGLPLGPLHLMPPTALRSLSFATKQKNVMENIDPQEGGVNTCVTVWAYINEKTGKVLDVGVERTLVSEPIALIRQPYHNF